MSLKSVLAIRPHGFSTKVPLYTRGVQSSATPEVDVEPRSWSSLTEATYLNLNKKQNNRVEPKQTNQSDRQVDARNQKAVGKHKRGNDDTERHYTTASVVHVP